MKKICSLILFGYLISSAAFAVAQHPTTVWVSSDKATLKSDRKSSSTAIAQLSKGTALAVLQYKKKWYQVKLGDGKTGWIYRGKVSKTEIEKNKGADDGGSIGGLLGDLSGSSIRADNTDSSRSIRGLSPEATEYAKQKGTPKIYRQELDKVIARKTSPEEIETFLKQGKIGEYQE